MAKLGVRMDFGYKDSKNTNRTIMYDVPTTAKMTEKSTCGDNMYDMEVLHVEWDDEWSLEMQFEFTNKSKKWNVKEVSMTVMVNKNNFPGSNYTEKTYTTTLKNQTLYMTGNGSSYQCVSDSEVNGFTFPELAGFTMNITTCKMRLEAFRGNNNTNFATSLPCAADTQVSNIVPIAVGAALAGLVVIVLVAYLIGRRKSKRGYESV